MKTLRFKLLSSVLATALVLALAPSSVLAAPGVTAQSFCNEVDPGTANAMFTGTGFTPGTLFHFVVLDPTGEVITLGGEVANPEGILNSGGGMFGLPNELQGQTLTLQIRTVGGEVLAQTTFVAAVCRSADFFVESLLAEGALTSGAANSLLVKLDAASSARNPATAVNQLEAFKHEVDAMVRSGRLGPDEAAILIAAADRQIAALSGS